MVNHVKSVAVVPGACFATIALTAVVARRQFKRMPIDATKPYDDGNIFARILRGELPCKKVYEDEHALAFHDVNPLAPYHVLVIPKGPYVSWDDFSAKASDAEMAGFVRAVGQVAREAGMVEQGDRLLANIGPSGSPPKMWIWRWGTSWPDRLPVLARRR